MESTIGKVASMSMHFQAGNEEGVLSSQHPVNREGLSAHSARRVSAVRFDNCDGIKELDTVVAQSDTSIV